MVPCGGSASVRTYALTASSMHCQPLKYAVWPSPRIVSSRALPSLDQILAAEDIADAIIYIVTRPRQMAINEILIRPTEQVR
jgi:hypothetical protein